MRLAQRLLPARSADVSGSIFNWPAGYYGSNYYRIKTSTGAETSRARYTTTDLPPGPCKVEASWPLNYQFTRRALYIISDGQGELGRVRKNQTTRTTQFTELGTFTSRDNIHIVEVSNEATQVLRSELRAITDAIRFVMVETPPGVSVTALEAEVADHDPARGSRLMRTELAVNGNG